MERKKITGEGGKEWVTWEGTNDLDMYEEKKPFEDQGKNQYVG